MGLFRSKKADRGRQAAGKGGILIRIQLRAFGQLPLCQIILGVGRQHIGLGIAPCCQRHGSCVGKSHQPVCPVQFFRAGRRGCFFHSLCLNRSFRLRRAGGRSGNGLAVCAFFFLFAGIAGGHKQGHTQGQQQSENYFFHRRI